MLMLMLGVGLKIKFWAPPPMEWPKIFHFCTFAQSLDMQLPKLELLPTYKRGSSLWVDLTNLQRGEPGCSKFDPFYMQFIPSHEPHLAR